MLPVDIADRVERLRTVHERISQLKQSREIEAGTSLTAWAPYEPFGVMEIGVRAALRMPQRAITTVVTNVPGPPAPLYILGRPIREILPWVPIANRMRIGVSVFTFDGQATFGVTTDFASVPESDLFAAVIPDEIAALAAALPAAEKPAAEKRAAEKPAAERPAVARTAPRSGRKPATTRTRPAPTTRVRRART